MKATLLFACALTLSWASPLKADLLLRYQLNEGTGTTLTDLGKAPLAPGQLVGNGASWSTDAPLQATASLSLQKSGGSSYVSAGTVGKLEGVTQFTLTTWVKLSSIASSDRLFSTRGSAGGFFDLRADSGSSATSLNLVLQFSNGTDTATAIASQPVNASDWVFLGVVYNGSTVRYYLGDETVSVSTLGSIVTVGEMSGINTSSSEFRLGGTAATATNRTPTGLFYDFRFYDNALNANELNAIRTDAIPEPSALISTSAATLCMLYYFKRRNKGAQLP